MWSQTEFKHEGEDSNCYTSHTQASRAEKHPTNCSTAILEDGMFDKVALAVPLSLCTVDLSHVPIKNTAKWVARSASIRRREVRQREGHIARPLNSFMLYRSAYIERARAWCRQNKEQILSTVIAASWKMEPSEVRRCYERYARLERSNHSKAHPTYKFSPSRAKLAYRRRQEYSSQEEYIEHPLHSRPISDHEEEKPPSANTESHIDLSTIICVGFNNSNLTMHDTWQPEPLRILTELSYYQYQGCYIFQDDYPAGSYPEQALNTMDMSIPNSWGHSIPYYARSDTSYASPACYHCAYSSGMYWSQPTLMFDGVYHSIYSPAMVAQPAHYFLSDYDPSTLSGFPTLDTRLGAVEPWLQESQVLDVPQHR